MVSDEYAQKIGADAYCLDGFQALAVIGSLTSTSLAIQQNILPTKLATPGGFEPPISTVTGWHVRPLHHGAVSVVKCSRVSGGILY